jgi:hypothetical protein
MALQTTGEISLANLQTVFGGANPISLSEYYKGGVYVPSEVANYVTEGPSYDWQNHFEQRTPYVCGYQGWHIKWRGVVIHQDYRVEAKAPASYTIGGATYIRGAQREFKESGAPGWVCGGPPEAPAFLSDQWEITKRTGAAPTPVNAGIPTTGQTSLAHYYGGTKT